MITTLAALAVFQDATRLKVGTAWSGEQVLHFHSEAQEIDETHRLAIGFKVTGSEDKMWVVQRTSRLLGTKIGDTELGPPPKVQPETFKEWLSPAGFLLRVDPHDRGVFSLDRLLHFWMPQNRPNGWKVDLSTTLEGQPSIKGLAQFTQIGDPGAYSREYRLKYTTGESKSDLSALGRMRFDDKTGRLLQAWIEVKNCDLPGGTIKADVSLVYADATMPKPSSEGFGEGW